MQAAVEERKGSIHFPHRIELGAADRSFGIEVARLAGLPSEVLTRAQQIADTVEPTSVDLLRHLSATIRRAGGGL